MAQQDPKVGTSPEAAKHFGGKLDFGTPADKAHPARRDVKTNVDRPSERAGQDGQRVVGVGATGATPGKSGGQADTDILGIGTQGGSSTSTDGTLNSPPGPDATAGGSAPFASGPPAKGLHQKDVAHKVGGDKSVKGTTHNAGTDDGSGVGDNADNAQREIAANDPNNTP